MCSLERTKGNWLEWRAHLCTTAFRFEKGHIMKDIEQQVSLRDFAHFNWRYAIAPFLLGKPISINTACKALLLCLWKPLGEHLHSLNHHHVVHVREALPLVMWMFCPDRAAWKVHAFTGYRVDTYRQASSLFNYWSNSCARGVGSRIEASPRTPLVVHRFLQLIGTPTFI